MFYFICAIKLYFSKMNFKIFRFFMIVMEFCTFSWIHSQAVLCKCVKSRVLSQSMNVLKKLKCNEKLENLCYENVFQYLFHTKI